MRAVNLLPSDLRGAATKPARGARPEPVQGIGAYVVLGALALCVAAFAGYVITTNGIKQREADLDAAKQRTAAATAKVAALKPYADFEALASARVETVRGLAAARFDWERALRDLSHAFPADAKLTTLNGDMGLPGSAATGGGDALRGSIQAPAITMTGCASSQTGVARMMARIKAVDGVTRVSLSKSDAGTASASGAGVSAASIPACGKNPATFSVVAFFERSAALSQYSTSAAAALPVPNAVNPADGAATTPSDPAAGSTPTDGSAAQPQAAATPSATPSTVTTTTPSEGTP